MKHLFLGVALCALCAIPAMADEAADSIDNLDAGFKFNDVKTVKHTSVKDQNKSGTCWSFCSTSFFEDEVMRQGGDSLDLSEMYTVRHCYSDKADRYVRYYGHTNFGPGGSALDAAYVIEKYGCVPEDVYSGLNYGEDGHNHGELDALLDGYVKTIVKKPNGKISTAWKKGYEGILDAYLGEEPVTFTVNGKQYTPKSYAKALGINTADYVALTSFTHHPFYEEFILEIPDNWLDAKYMNVPMEEMKAVVDNAIENGFTVAWAADVSEQGFKWYDGVALMPLGKTEGDMTGSELARWVKLNDRDRQNEKYNFTGPVPEETITQEMRQQMFDNQQTTDDHGMEIVGIATDQNGNRYYKVKNSWNTNQVYDGYIYVSEPYFLAKTMDIYVHKDAVPRDIAKKIGLKK